VRVGSLPVGAATAFARDSAAPPRKKRVNPERKVPGEVCVRGPGVPGL